VVGCVALRASFLRLLRRECECERERECVSLDN